MVIKRATKKTNSGHFVNTVLNADEALVKPAIRPRFLHELIGREREKQILSMLIKSVRKRREEGETNAALDHILLYGPPGLGKTTLAMVLANEIGVNIKITSGPAIEKQGDLVAILTNLEEGDVLFIDEIHRLKKNIEEILYPAMEDFKIDIVLGQGPSAQSVRLTLPHFTLVGATTRVGLLSSPFRDRFGVLLHLDFFENADLEQIINRLVTLDKIEMEPAAVREIAIRSRGTARIAIRLYRRVRDFARAGGSSGCITQKMAVEALDLLGVDSLGLDDLDRKILRLIIEKFNGGPVGLKALAAALSEEIDTIEDVYEPYLLRLGLIKRTPRGRVATEKAYKHLRLPMLKNAN